MSDMEFDVSKDTLTKTNVGSRNTAVILTNEPLPLSDKNPIYKKNRFGHGL